MSIPFLVFILVLPCPLDARIGGNAATQAIVKVGSAWFSNRTEATTKGSVYTQNSFCRTNNCINPIFPGLNDLPKLEALQWQCTTNRMVRDYMDFCKAAVPYDPSLPSPVSKATPVNELVRAQEDAAMTMFVIHLNGMGYDAWDYRNPSMSDSDCVRTVWKMVCYTYFPRAAAGCNAGEKSTYKRPCGSSCNNYIKHCGVSCCDESVECVFSNPEYDTKGNLVALQTGYVDASGPSAMCTGSSKHSTSSPWFLLLTILGFHWASASATHAEQRQEGDLVRGRAGSRKYFVLCFAIFTALLLQGCNVDIPRHTVGNWRQIPSFLEEYSYLPPGKTAVDAILNSCSLTNVPIQKKCGGKGYCKAFSENSYAAQQSALLAFCQCEPEWADPECNTRRKSQMTAFFLSLFFGVFGADYFYLGFPLWAVAKLCTLGGLGFWWLVDIVRIGSGPVYANDFRTAPDLPHWVAMLTMIFLCMVCGFGGSVLSYLFQRREKRRDILNLQTTEASTHWKHTLEDTGRQFGGPKYRAKEYPKGSQIIDGRPGFSGYGATLPLPHPNAQAPYARV